MAIKGLILAGGYGTRIRPCSYYLNKHMWPIYDKPLIEYAVESLIWADITDIGIVLGGSHPKQVESYLGDGARYGAEFTYVWQGAPRGIAHAVYCAQAFVGHEKFVVHLADNLLEDPIEDIIKDFREDYECLVVLKEGADVKKFGCAEFKDGQLIRIIEKPEKPLSESAQVGVYGFDSYFFQIFPTLKPSWRGEYEQADMVNRYLGAEKKVDVKFLKGAWFDCGEFKSILEASNFMCSKQVRRERRV